MTAPDTRRAFTIVELLVVVAVIGVLIGLTTPALSEANRFAKRTVCQSNLRQVGVGVHTYANEHANSIPYGPKAPPATATNFYPVTGNVTSLISLYTGAPVGLGLMLEDQLSRTPRVLFCPDPDQPYSAEAALALVGTAQAQGGFYYRHASVTALSPLTVPQSFRPPIKLNHLGNNRDGRPIRLLAMDTQFHAPAGMIIFGIVPRSHHQQRLSNALATDGSVASHENTDRRFNVDISATPYEALDRILEVFELIEGGSP